MNKTNYATNGGFPEFLDDFTFEQESIRDTFKGVMSAFGLTAGGDLIISGCDLYGTFLTNYNSGYLFLKGEIYKVDGGLVPALGFGLTRVWVADLSYDVSGDKVLENTSSTHAYHVRKAKMVSAVYDGLIHMNANTAKTLSDKIIQIAVNDNDTNDLAGKILTVMDGDDWITLDANTKYRKDKEGFVHLIGVFGILSNTLTLPLGFRPSVNQSFQVSCFDSNGASSIVSFTGLTVSSLGVIAAGSWLTGSGTQRMIDLKGVSFKAV
ncbi:MAG: hypothetical protein K8R85_11140 [Bacteroidetes bacterium]|nr:hypothetical protein [Bacteroidota bacterium]